MHTRRRLDKRNDSNVTIAIVPDANALYSFIPRDLFVQLRLIHEIHLHWTDTLSDEWTRNLAKNTNQDQAKFQKIVDEMEAIVPDGRVDDYVQFIPLFPNTDAKDRHVAAAAKRVQLDYAEDDVEVWLATWNINDFDAAELKAQGIRLCTPGIAFCDLLAQNVAQMCLAVTNQMKHMGKSQPDIQAYLARLPAVSLSQLAAAIQPHVNQFPQGWPGP